MFNFYFSLSKDEVCEKKPARWLEEGMPGHLIIMMTLFGIYHLMIVRMKRERGIKQAMMNHIRDHAAIKHRFLMSVILI